MVVAVVGAVVVVVVGAVAFVLLSLFLFAPLGGGWWADADDLLFFTVPLFSFSSPDNIVDKGRFLGIFGDFSWLGARLRGGIISSCPHNFFSITASAARKVRKEFYGVFMRHKESNDATTPNEAFTKRSHLGDGAAPSAPAMPTTSETTASEDDPNIFVTRSAIALVCESSRR